MKMYRKLVLLKIHAVHYTGILICKKMAQDQQKSSFTIMTKQKNLKSSSEDLIRTIPTLLQRDFKIKVS